MGEFPFADDQREEVSDRKQLFDKVHSLQESKTKWLFRGQPYKKLLRTLLERECSRSGIGLYKAPSIEWKMMRDFRRLYDGQDQQKVQGNILYCLTLMQHHGAPTRLLDFTYSAFIAAYLALQEAHNKSSDENSSDACGDIWCLNEKWLSERAKKIAGDDLKKRLKDEERGDRTFCALYMKKPKPHKIIYPENPFLLHTRLARQQGVFICPGDITCSAQEILESLDGWDKKDNVLIIHCNLDRDERLRALEELHRMNINRTMLFPGLDGFAQSMKYRLKFYRDLKP